MPRRIGRRPRCFGRGCGGVLPDGRCRRAHRNLHDRGLAIATRRDHGDRSLRPGLQDRDDLSRCPDNGLAVGCGRRRHGSFPRRRAALATVPVAALLAQGAGAYLAIEPADASWPPLKTGEAATAGPFHLVWLRSDKTAVAPEHWPARISRIEEVQPLGKRFPMILPCRRTWRPPIRSERGSRPSRSIA